MKSTIFLDVFYLCSIYEAMDCGESTRSNAVPCTLFGKCPLKDAREPSGEL